ncbi:TIGR01777 family oxidoreductase [Chengkuizengella sediminis]|uniref:TIGR01777 family oxidoreductase n=1 Tax=Chengkuizengella sediminis TaxID=1885917 RepID=UPI0013896CF6|nr:TIGR01777 family oxidoreductase [Chengkuizengella sediminis]NDI34131.1 TIGR01777 family protein [Chengkuizengella sediminis]
MRIGVTGGTGFIGKHLTRNFLRQNHKVCILTRKPDSYQSDHKNLEYIGWSVDSINELVDKLEGMDVFINLAGESINNGRWTEQQKERIIKTRIQVTDTLMKLFSELYDRPKLFINASAVGYYGTSLKQTFIENDLSTSGDFLAKTVQKWEKHASKAENLGIRTVYTRFGIVLDKQEGALPKMVLPYKLFVGGKVGTGKQWLSWIHIKDVVNLIDFIIHNGEFEGAVNFTTPFPLQMNEFGKTIGEVLSRPHYLPAPSFALKMMLGEMSTLVLDGQKVLPNKAQQLGFKFEFPTLRETLMDIYRIK